MCALKLIKAKHSYIIELVCIEFHQYLSRTQQINVKSVEMKEMWA
jgi:hypothetical protein